MKQHNAAWNKTSKAASIAAVNKLQKEEEEIFMSESTIAANVIYPQFNSWTLSRNPFPHI